MTLAEIITFASVVTLLVMSPGPNGVLIAKTVPTSGRLAGFATVFGFMASFYLHGALSIFGISLILLQSAWAFSIVKYLGALYLLWIGAKALYAAIKGTGDTAMPTPAKRQRGLWKAMAEGFLTNALNPKVSMFYLAAFPQFITVGESSFAGSFTLVSLHAAINGLWFSAMVLLLARLTSATQNQRFQRWLKGVTGVVFMGFGLKLASIKPSL